jgi:L-asparaginase
MPRVAVVFTGGTISMGFDPVAGGNVPTLDGAAILARTPGLDEIAEVAAIDRGLTPASHFSFADLDRLWAVIAERLADQEVDGVVVVQGTDTIEETAFAWDLRHGAAGGAAGGVAGGTPGAMSKPIVVTGAMRAAHEEGYDGPANLRDAVTVAASPAAREVGVVVTLSGTIEPADDVTKTHTSSFTTFQSPNGGPLGRVHDGAVELIRRRGPRRHVAGSVTDAGPRIHLVTAGIGTTGELLDAAVAAGADGIVVAATGSGNTAPGLLAAAERAMADGIPVVLASRCLAGPVGTAYAFPGGGATWVRAGAIPAGTLCAIKARVALTLGVAAGLDRAGLTTLLADPLP